MYRKKKCLLTIGWACLWAMLFLSACSNKKNTAVSRAYHSVNTRYNVHFNANEAYKESLKNKERVDTEADNLSKMLHIYPEILDSADLKHRNSFTATIDKTTKAIKLHSIKTRPQRDPNKRMDKKYQEWVNRQEFNPFLDNTWMLLAKAEFWEGDYLRAITTFMYITKIYHYDKKMVSESKLWIARAYSEMGWRYEAENVLRKMEQNDEIHHQLLGMYASVKANIYVHSKQYENAIPYLEEAIRKGKNGNQKRRNKYLLGQLYTELGENKKAYKAFGDVGGFSAPRNYVISSKLKQLEVSDEPQKKIVSELNKLTKGVRNEEYLDQVYTALGNVYLNSLDTLKAIESYSKAIEKSTKDGYNKALAQIKLGGIHFRMEEYIKAQPHYSGALPQLKKADDFYTEVSLRSEVLDQLVVHAKVVHEQDSLLLLATMPEGERIAFIEKHIEELKKEEERLKKEQELAVRRGEAESQNQPDYSEWEELLMRQGAQMPAAGSAVVGGSDFYFYNRNAVEQGKVAFQRKWGRRALEDNWRRKNKVSGTSFGGFEEDDLPAETPEEAREPQEGEVAENEATESEQGEMVTDKYSVEYYMQQLPLTESAKEASYKLVENGLFNMGLIYKDLLEDNRLAINAFEEDLKRFPNTPNKEEIYYQLFLIYLRLGKDAEMALYRNKIINEFSSGKYAIPLGDENYAWNFKYMAKMQEDLYQETYAAYLAGNVNKVRQNYEEIKIKFPFVSLMPKFAFLHSLTYAQTKDAKGLEKNLTKLIADYPQADVTPMATDILKNIKDGMILLSDGTPITSMDWTMAYSNDSLFADSTRVIEYRADLDKPHVMLLLFKPKSIDRNELLYQVADYNFSNYVIQTYDLRFEENPVFSSLEISGFKDYKTIKSYTQKALAEEGLLTKIDKEITPIPISVANFEGIYPRLGLEAYMHFYADSLGREIPQLLAHWGKETNQLLAETTLRPTAETIDPTQNVEEEELKNPVVIETGEEKINFPQRGQTQEPKKEDKTNDKEVNLEEVLTEEQVKIIETVNQKYEDGVDAVQAIIDNPVEGLKNLFNRNKFEENLTKEEKEELKQQQREEKERKKELQKIIKAKEDSIATVEKLRLDSIKQEEKAIGDSINLVEKIRKEQLELESRERKQAQKDREETRQRELREREDLRKQQLHDYEEKSRQQEKERKDLQRQRDQQQKGTEKAALELRKQKENEREEKRNQQEQERKKLQQEQERRRGDLQRQRDQQRKDAEKAALELRKQKEREREEKLKQSERERKEQKR